MADTWAADSDNQLVTFKAFINGVTSYGLACGYDTTPPDTREIMTVGDLNTYGVFFYDFYAHVSLYSTFTGISNSTCLTKIDFLSQAQFETSSTNVASCTTGGLSSEILYSNALFAIGTQLYTSRLFTTAKTFSTSRWLFNYSGGAGSYQVSTAGVILDIVYC